MVERVTAGPPKPDRLRFSALSFLWAKHGETVNPFSPEMRMTYGQLTVFM